MGCVCVKCAGCVCVKCAGCVWFEGVCVSGLPLSGTRLIDEVSHC